MANVAVLNTTNQLSGKTLAVCENDQTISGAWTFTGNQAFNGNVTIGNAVSDTLTVTSVITSSLLFTDATYDLGASGATRPRDLFLSRNAVIGGTLGVTGVATLSASTIGLRGVTYTLPSADGAAGAVLTTDGAAGLTWAGSNKLVLLKSNSGTDTNAAAANVDTISISGLTAKDRILIAYTMDSATQTTANPRFYNNTDSVVIAQVNGTNNLTVANGLLVGQTWIQQVQTAATRVAGWDVGTPIGSSPTGSVASGHDVTFTTNWTGSWTLALRHGGVTAGGTFRWSWSVFKLLGQ